jgi:hypothetical protein
MQGKTRIWLGMVLLFLAGAAVGFTTSGLVMRRHFRGIMRGGMRGMNARIIRDITRDLELTGDQRRQIMMIVEETTPVMDQMGKDFRNSMEEVSREQIERIKALLDDEQKRAVDERMEKIRKRIEMMEQGRRKPRHRPRRDRLIDEGD